MTKEQIEQAREKLNKVQERASEVNEVIVKAGEAVLRDREGNTIVDLTTAQKTSLLSEYAKRKQLLIDAVNSLL